MLSGGTNLAGDIGYNGVDQVLTTDFLYQFQYS